MDCRRRCASDGGRVDEGNNIVNELMRRDAERIEF